MNLVAYIPPKIFVYVAILLGMLNALRRFRVKGNASTLSRSLRRIVLCAVKTRFFRDFSWNLRSRAEKRTILFEGLGSKREHSSGYSGNRSDLLVDWKSLCGRCPVDQLQSGRKTPVSDNLSGAQKLREPSYGVSRVHRDSVDNVAKFQISGKESEMHWRRN
jgi:hypothetical protein